MKIKIIYASESGSTRYVSNVIQNQLTTEGHVAEVHCLNTDGLQVELTGFDLLLFGSPTYDDGQPQMQMVKFMNQSQANFSQTKTAVFCLGESWYPHFCGAAAVLEKWITDHSGNVVIPTLKIDGYPLDTTFIADWIKKVLAVTNT